MHIDLFEPVSGVEVVSRDLPLLLLLLLFIGLVLLLSSKIFKKHKDGQSGNESVRPVEAMEAMQEGSDIPFCFISVQFLGDEGFCT